MRTYEELLAAQTELAHFNPNHDPRNGQFTSDQKGTLNAAKKGVKISKSKFKPWYRQYDPLLKDKSLNRSLDSDKELIEARKASGDTLDELNRAYDDYEKELIRRPLSDSVIKKYNAYKLAEEQHDAAYEKASKLARSSVDRYMNNIGQLDIKSPEYRLLVAYALKFYPTAPNRDK